MNELVEMRKIVPIIAKVGVGKSKLLNVLYNIKYLEVNTGITTKFINILRYNPEIKEPILYHLILKKEGEKYLFYKDLNEKYEGEENIIEANKNINQKLNDENKIIYENIFYMTEINGSPYINRDYLLSHDLCDIPGLSEYQAEIKEPIKEEAIKNEIKNESEDKKEYIQYDDNKLNFNNNNENNNGINNIDNSINNSKEDNYEDDIYYKAGDIKNKTYLKEIFQIIRNYVDNAIIILNIENYYYEENFIIITQLHKIIKK